MDGLIFRPSSLSERRDFAAGRIVIDCQMLLLALAAGYLQLGNTPPIDP
jgi:hypothetical protein